MIFLLDDDNVGFPDPRLGEEDGLFAVGGALTPDWLLIAYSNGIFPWYDYKSSNEIQWWCPMQRFVIFPKEIHISHSMRQVLRKGDFQVTFNQAFEQVMRNCGKAQGRDEQEGAWLGEHIVKAYTELHKLGFAVSVEVWHNQQLVGGLYGVAIGKNFVGESMFSLVPNGSKIALVTLAEVMKDTDGIIDCQLETPHLKSMGGRMISYDEYLVFFE